MRNHANKFVEDDMRLKFPFNDHKSSFNYLSFKCDFIVVGTVIFGKSTSIEIAHQYKIKN